MLRAMLVGLVVVLAGCGSSTGTDFSGTWTGTKAYLNGDGSVAGSSSWAVSIQDAGAQSLLISGDVAATVDSASSFTVGRHAYAPAASPGPAGHCAPTTATILDGTGTLAGPDTLRITLHWIYECGGASTNATTVYDLQRASGSVQPVPL